MRDEKQPLLNDSQVNYQGSLNTLTMRNSPTQRMNLNDLLRSCCFNHANQEEFTSWQNSLFATIKNILPDVNLIELVKEIAKNKKVHKLIKETLAKSNEANSIVFNSQIGSLFVVQEFGYTLKYNNVPTDKQIAFASMIGQVIGLIPIALITFKRIIKNEPILEGLHYEFTNFQNEFTYNFFLTLFIVGLFQTGEMPNNWRTMSELTGLAIGSLLISFMTNESTRNVIYKYIETKSGKPLSSKTKKGFNFFFTAVTASSTAEWTAYVLQSFAATILPDLSILDPYSGAMDMSRWVLMGVYALAKATMEIVPPPKHVREKIEKVENIVLQVINTAFLGINFYWLVQLFQQDKDDSYDPYVAATLNVVCILTAAAIIGYKTYNKIFKNNVSLIIEHLEDTSLLPNISSAINDKEQKASEEKAKTEAVIDVKDSQDVKDGKKEEEKEKLEATETTDSENASGEVVRSTPHTPGNT